MNDYIAWQLLEVLGDADLDNETARQVAYDLLLSQVTEVPENQSDKEVA